MYFQASEIEDLLRCTYCKSSFTSAIKLIPECGNSICQVCHDWLRKEADESRVYLCKECGEKHSLPANGLSDNKALLKVLTLQATAQSENEHADVFSVQMKSLQARIDKLKDYDVKEEIAAHCDKLWKEVMAAVDNAFDHLNKLGNHLLTQINEYRDNVLAANQRATTKRFKSARPSVQEDIEALANKLVRLGDEVQFQAASSPDDSVFVSALNELNSLASKLDKVENELKTEAFDGKIMRFELNNLFDKASSHLGKMVLDCVKAIENHTDRQNGSCSRFDEEAAPTCTVTSQLESSVLNLTGHREPVRQVLFLPNGDLLSCSDDRTIKQWDLKNKRLLFELFGSISKVTTMVLMSNNYLATGCADNAIYLWDLHERRLCQRIQGHGHAIFALQTLSNGNLVSASFDGSIKIWELRRKKLFLVDTIFGHGVRLMTNIGVIDGTQLVACSNDRVQNDDGVIKIWTTRPIILLSTILTHNRSCCALQVLKNRRVAFGFRSGKIDIYTLRQDNDCLRINAYQTEGSFCLAESPEGDLLSGGPCTDPTIKLWNPNTGQLIRTILSGHLDGICSMSISSDGKVLATASPDMTVKVFPLSN